jgi:hypothetical protein
MTDRAQQLDFAPYEIRSFVIEQDGSWHPVNLLEEPALGRI